MSEEVHRSMWNGWIGLVLVLLCVSVYGRVVQYDFINYDDPAYVSGNRFVRAGLTGAGVSWAFTSMREYWIPLTRLTRMMDCQWYGLNAGGHHATNLILHILSTLSLFWVLKKMTGERWPSAMVAALFAVHPLHVESVAWVTERKDVLYGLFWILGAGAYARYARTRRQADYALTAVLFVLGLMSKPMMVTFPLILFCLDLWPLGRIGNEDWRSLIREKIPLVLISTVFCVVTMIAQKQEAMRSLVQCPLTGRIANAMLSYAGYITNMVWPANLAVFYPYSAPPLVSWTSAGACAVLIVISAAVVKRIRPAPYLLAGWVWYGVTLLPVIGIVQVGWQAMADRYAYIPLIGLFIMAVWTGRDLAQRWNISRASCAVAAGLVIAALSIAAWVQAGYWKDSFTLFGRTLKVTQNNWLAHHSFGMALAEKGRIPAAVAHYRRSLDIRPEFEKPYNNLGVIAYQQGHYPQAVEYFSSALKYKPQDPEIHNNLGLALERAGMLKEAMVHYCEAIRQEPDHAGALNNLGYALTRCGRIDEALEFLCRAAAIDPESPEVRNNLANALSEKGLFEEAVAQYHEVLRRNPYQADPYYNLGILYGNVGRLDAAAAHYRKALNLTPNDPDAHMNLARILERQGKTGESNVHFVRSRCILGESLAKHDKIDEATAQYSEALKIDPQCREAREWLEKLQGRRSRADTDAAEKTVR